MTKISPQGCSPLIDLSEFMELKYRSGARGEDGFVDCWGLGLMIRVAAGKSRLPEFAEARHGRKGSIQAAYEQLKKITKEGQRESGVIAAVLRNKVCVHVAALVNADEVIEIKRSGTKPRVMALSDWIRDYPAPMWEVTFHD